MVFDRVTQPFVETRHFFSQLITGIGEIVNYHHGGISRHKTGDVIAILANCEGHQRARWIPLLKADVTVSETLAMNYPPRLKLGEPEFDGPHEFARVVESLGELNH